MSATVTGVKGVVAFLDPKRMGKVVTRTLNETAKQGKTAGAKGITTVYNIEAGRIKKNISVVKATKTTPEAVVRTEGRAPGLQHFKSRGGNRLKSGKLKPVTAEVLKGKRKKVEGGFLAEPRGGKGIFKRKGAPRLPIKRLLGPDPVEMMEKAGEDDIKKVHRDNMPRIFKSKFDFEFGKR